MFTWYANTWEDRGGRAIQKSPGLQPLHSWFRWAIIGVDHDEHDMDMAHISMYSEIADERAPILKNLLKEMSDVRGKRHWSARIPGTHKALGPALGPNDPLHPQANPMLRVAETGQPCPPWYRDLLIEIRDTKPYVLDTLRSWMLA